MNVGDLVSRNSYNNDIIFKITAIDGEIAYLKGVEDRLVADASISDLKHEIFYEKYEPDLEVNDMNRDEYFYMPGKILHLDGDEEYLEKAMNFYKKCGVKAVGKKVLESNMPDQVFELLKNVKPDILIITGHDSYNKKDRHGNLSDYKNSKYFVDAVKCARMYESSHDKLIIIAGACQSAYEELLISGANFASSPKRINIHALDPSIIAVSLALTNKYEDINIKEVLNRTKYGSNGMGGIVTKGLMYVGYPR